MQRRVAFACLIAIAALTTVVAVSRSRDESHPASASTLPRTFRPPTRAGVRWLLGRPTRIEPNGCWFYAGPGAARRNICFGTDGRVSSVTGSAPDFLHPSRR